ncbi:TlpA family protein disulfide reductase [Paenibacillus senegalensis]|uniref:TlpA family protein disulfide reductase n=1 Tax=Paenibacillus senegalensis TaxID=1465766 RepID=UPI0002880099|nr:TlpA disulfide reductase family protein [Paenibacillus senegalensis]
MGKRVLLTVMVLWLGVGIAAIDHFKTYEEASTQIMGPRLNHMAPQGKLSTLDGTVLAIGGSRDKPLLLNFWASWCGPCQEEAPFLQALYEKYGDQIDFYAIHATHDDRRENVEPFIQANGWTFPVLLDEEGHMAEQYRIMGYPTSFILDREGRIRDQFYYEPPRLMEERIRRSIE